MDLRENVPLDRYSTLHVGGAARYFTTVKRLEDLRSALTWAEDQGLAWFVLGGGTNFFCREGSFPGLMIKMEPRGLTFDGKAMTTEAGVVTRLAALQAVQRGLRGLEHLAGIPGTVGGAVRGNAGSFGTETADHLRAVRVLQRTSSGWTEEVLPRARLSFAYRDSPFKRAARNYVIWSATFTLSEGDRTEGERLVAEDFAARKAQQPYEFPSVGSIFKNPEPGRTAGMLIEASGLKGLRVGGAEVSLKHANFIVNRGGATAQDVLKLMAEIKTRVFETSGLTLEEEIVIV